MGLVRGAKFRTQLIVPIRSQIFFGKFLCKMAKTRTWSLNLTESY